MSNINAVIPLKNGIQKRGGEVPSAHTELSRSISGGFTYHLVLIFLFPDYMVVLFSTMRTPLPWHPSPADGRGKLMNDALTASLTGETTEAVQSRGEVGRGIEMYPSFFRSLSLSK